MSPRVKCSHTVKSGYKHSDYKHTLALSHISWAKITHFPQVSCLAIAHLPIITRLSETRGVIMNRVDYSAGATGVVESHSFLPYSSSHCSVSLSKTASSSAVQFCTSLPAIHFVVPITFGCAARMLCLAPAARQLRCVTAFP